MVLIRLLPFSAVLGPGQPDLDFLRQNLVELASELDARGHDVGEHRKFAESLFVHRPAVDPRLIVAHDCGLRARARSLTTSSRSLRNSPSAELEIGSGLE